MPLLSISFHPHLHPGLLIQEHQITWQVCHHYFPLILFALVTTKLEWQTGHCPLFLENAVLNVSPTMSLSLVFHVPKFATNLLSISCITCDLNCSVIFFHLTVFFRTCIRGRRLDFTSLMTVWILNCQQLVFPVVMISISVIKTG